MLYAILENVSFMHTHLYVGHSEVGLMGWRVAASVDAVQQGRDGPSTIVPAAHPALPQSPAEQLSLPPATSTTKTASDTDKATLGQSEAATQGLAREAVSAASSRNLMGALPSPWWWGLRL